MKDKINKVVDDLKQGVIDEKKARTLLLGLVGVIASIFDWFEHLLWEVGWMITVGFFIVAQKFVAYWL